MTHPENGYPFEIRNGSIEPASVKFIDASNRAFRFGDGLFETICVRNCTPLFFSDHCERLFTSLAKLEMPAPVGFEAAFLKKQIEQLLKCNNEKSGRVRLTVYRDASGFYKPENMQSSWVLSLNGNVPYQYQLNERGLSVELFKDVVKPKGAFSNLKTLNGLPYILAGIAATKAGCDDMFLMNTDGNIIEATSSNIFLRKGTSVYTPHLSEGCLDGIMRKNVITILKKNNQEIIESPVTLLMLKEADEIFLTNVISGVRWVAAFAGYSYGNELSDKVVNWINSEIPENHRVP